MAKTLKSNLAMGLAAGLAGTAAMGAYWMAVQKLGPKSNAGGGEEPTTNEVAKRVLRRAGVRSPSKQTRAVGGQVVHWGYGASWGLVAGLARSAGVRMEWGGGQLFGAGLWALGDLWMLYRMGLAKHPREYPAQAHAASLGAHMAYGLGTWAAFEGLERLAGEKKTGFLRRAA